jgi:hypothetical protein
MLVQGLLVQQRIMRFCSCCLILSCWVWWFRWGVVLGGGRPESCHNPRQEGLFAGAARQTSSSCVRTILDGRNVCTDNAAKIYHAHRSGVGSSSTTSNSPFYMKYIGIEQSIMGSKKEIEGTKEVISKMEEYLMNEVFAKPEYAVVRNKW